MMKKQLKRDPDFRKKYKETINIYIEMGYAKKLSREEACRVSEKRWYVPHHPVFNRNKPEKFRMVFDAASEYNENSLNKALLTGPDLLNSFMEVNCGFVTTELPFQQTLKQCITKCA